MKKFKISVLLIIGLILILLATTVISQAVSEIKTTVENAICAILRIFQALAAGVAALMIILQGVKWMTSEDPAGRKAAKDMITHVFVAMIIIIIAVQFVNYLVTGTGIAEFTSCPGVTGPVVPPKVVGDSCTASSQCDTGLYCRNSDKTCQNRLGNGDSCAGKEPVEGGDPCQGGYYCSTTTNICKESPNSPPVPQITEKTKSALQCLKFELYGSITDIEEGSPCCTYKWNQVDCNTFANIATLGNGIGNAPKLTYTYTKAEPAGDKCIELVATDSGKTKGGGTGTPLEGRSGKPYTKVYLASNNVPKINEIKLSYPNNRDPQFHDAAIGEEFILEAILESEGGVVNDKNEFKWSSNPSDCTANFNPNNAKKTTAKITANSGASQCKITLTVTDSCGQTSTKDVDMTVISNQKPTPNIRFSKNEVPEGESVTLIGSDSRAGGDCPATGLGSVEAGDKIDKYEWRWTGPSSGTASGETPSVSLGKKNGAYTIHLKVTDLHGAQCERSDILVVCENLPSTNDAPIADASNTAKTGKARVALTLDASKSYDPDDFNPGHYNPAGAYQCTGSGRSGAEIERYYWRMKTERGISVDKCVPGCDTYTTGLECYVKNPTCIYTPEYDGDYVFELKTEDDALPGLSSKTSSRITVKINPP